MKILGHIHTFNDDDVIDRSLGALLNQSHPLDDILIVDNGSTDNTLNRPFPDKVHIIRHGENLGTNGTVITGFKYALEKGYDWIWVFDADSAPRPDALEELLKLFNGFSSELQEQTIALGSLSLDAVSHEPRHGLNFIWKGLKPARTDPEAMFYKCDVSIWSGSFFKMSAVKVVGLPHEEYVLDYGEVEYWYRCKQAGYKTFISQKSVMMHDMDGHKPYQVTQNKFGPFSIQTLDSLPIRTYYYHRNNLYFWLYQYQERSIIIIILQILKSFYRTALFLFRPILCWPQLKAGFRGIWDGFFKNLHHRY